jgi:hypothetical protein
MASYNLPMVGDVALGIIATAINSFSFLYFFYTLFMITIGVHWWFRLFCWASKFMHCPSSCHPSPDPTSQLPSPMFVHKLLIGLASSASSLLSQWFWFLIYHLLIVLHVQFKLFLQAAVYCGTHPF